MAEKSTFFNSINGDRKYKAEDMAAHFAKVLTNGVMPAGTQLQVIESDGMNVVVSAGSAWINGYAYHNDANFVLKIDPADGALNRVDRIVVRWDRLSRSINLVVLKGTPATSATAPDIVRSADYYDLSIATINVNMGVTAINQELINDTRMDSNVCGFVSSLIQPDTSGWFEQFEAGFNKWFDGVKDTLGGNVAGNLQNQINDLQNQLETLEIPLPDDIATLFGLTGDPQLNNVLDKLSGATLTKTEGKRLVMPISDVPVGTKIFMASKTFIKVGDNYPTVNSAILYEQPLSTMAAYDTNSFNYAGSDVDSYLDTTFIDSLPETVKNALVNADIKADETTIQRKAFLLSAKELGFASNFDEGILIPYFDSDTKRKADKGALSSNNYFTRTKGSTSDKVIGCSSSGTKCDLSYNSKYGYRAAIVLPSTFTIYKSCDGTAYVEQTYRRFSTDIFGNEFVDDNAKSRDKLVELRTTERVGNIDIDLSEFDIDQYYELIILLNIKPSLSNKCLRLNGVTTGYRIAYTSGTVGSSSNIALYQGISTLSLYGDRHRLCTNETLTSYFIEKNDLGGRINTINFVGNPQNNQYFNPGTEIIIHGVRK